MNDFVPVRVYEEFPDISLTEVFKLIDHTAKNLERIKRVTVSEADLTPPQYQILFLLWERDERPFKELANELSCSRATITGIIDTLERKRLVVRRPNPDDRRSLLATLTGKGRALQKKTPLLEQVYSNCCDGLSPQEYMLLDQLLRKLNNSLDYPEGEQNV